MFVSCAHILLKHQGSRTPKSWRDPNGSRIRNTTLEQAKTQMSEIRQRILNGEVKFYDVASAVSDCGSAQTQGKLGSFERNKMQKGFEDASFALKVGEISDVVVTDSGVHIILRYE